MATELGERAPDGLRAVYAEDLGPLPFTVDDIVATGRRRQRRRAIRTLAGAVVAAAAVGVGASGVLGGATTADRVPVEPARTTSTTSTTLAVTYPGCADEPSTCAAVVAQWSREVAGSTAGLGAAAHGTYDPGTRVFEQRVSSDAGGQDVVLTFVISPSSAEPQNGFSRIANWTRLPGFPALASRWTARGPGTFVDRLVVPKGGFTRSAGVQLDLTNHGTVGGPFASTSRAITPPPWWTVEAIGDLMTRVYGTDAIRQAAATASPSGTTTR